MENRKLTAGHNPLAIGGQGLFAAERLASNEKVFELRITEMRTRTSIELEEGVFSEGADEFNDYLNHHCDPNLYVDFTEHCLRARWVIEPREELFMNYLTTEWELVAPFACSCGSDYCFGCIGGFHHLLVDQREKLKQVMSPHPVAKHLLARAR
jgi:SET domain-containing protein